MILLSTATRSSKFSVSTMHLTKRWHLTNTEKQNLTLSELLNQIFFHENPSSMQILALSPESQVGISVITSCTCWSWKVRGGFGRNEPAKPKKSRGKVLSGTGLHSLLKPQSEVGGVTNHFQEVWGVHFLIFLGPHAAHELRRLHSPGKDKTGGKIKTVYQ